MKVRLVVVDAEKASRAWGSRVEIGHIWAVSETTCPVNSSNCRNCGDPETPCTGDEHCPQCGVDHGVAPDRILALKGLALQEVV